MEIDIPEHTVKAYPYGLAFQAAKKPLLVDHKATKNTALYELKLLSLLMREAMRRGITERNPCQGLGIRQDRPREKPEITDKEIALIRQELVRLEDGKRMWPEWMEIAFEIGIHQDVDSRRPVSPWPMWIWIAKRSRSMGRGGNGLRRRYTTG